ncbi:hypothetical protein INR38_27205 [Delftia sp. SD018]|jgi:hypothetical protein|uniref:hypothetical protein n=1 Tax=Delftia sp. SD018 TaxID=2781389 RepID=UPI001A971113|nr:hypothetical protein [Delftia sp. SD018]MBO1037771.1 hypothetical protein [Delftia sp. SD018]
MQPRSKTLKFNPMDTRILLLHLEHPLQAYSGSASPVEIVLAGLGYEASDYWPGLAIEWLEQGAPVNAEVLQALARVSENKHISQRIRHRSFAVLHRHKA